MWRLMIVLLLVTIGSPLGCSQPTVEPGDHDSIEAHILLETALAAWKAGEVKKLAASTPPLRFVDDDYAAGFTLVSYSLDVPLTEVLVNEAVSATLTLRDRAGHKVIRQAQYQISFQPGAAVLRSDT